MPMIDARESEDTLNSVLSLHGIADHVVVVLAEYVVDNENKQDFRVRMDENETANVVEVEDVVRSVHFGADSTKLRDGLEAVVGQLHMVSKHIHEGVEDSLEAVADNLKGVVGNTHCYCKGGGYALEEVGSENMSIEIMGDVGTDKEKPADMEAHVLELVHDEDDIQADTFQAVAEDDTVGESEDEDVDELEDRLVALRKDCLPGEGAGPEYIGGPCGPGRWLNPGDGRRTVLNEVDGRDPTDCGAVVGTESRRGLAIHRELEAEDRSGAANPSNFGCGFASVDSFPNLFVLAPVSEAPVGVVAPVVETVVVVAVVFVGEALLADVVLPPYIHKHHPFEHIENMQVVASHTFSSTCDCGMSNVNKGAQ
ncbi:UNVERIFIED_CONTAM: hypothetical protein HDU68_000040 [Siphonaria sp. JEL0065]|nr:hypothetical protein HDU68_000040 [Siphonaria sp. JEL0065]